ncbi:MAG: putative NTP pyrophosphohydrolase [Rhodobacteraceae bacterium HLUCCA12]|nr:MAG: putative NTP pyrophosphohydrolase [Rhodobacteraceae bacterium HLUCCA12]
MKQTPFQTLVSLIEPVFKRPEFIQAAALCLREGRRGREVLLVSSLDTGRWILPKGWPMRNRSLAGAAQQEAWEEAGVIGKAEESPIGFFTYEKKRAGGLPVACRVEVFRIAVADLAKDWPERDRRKRRWMLLDDAARRVKEPDLKTLLLSL